MEIDKHKANKHTSDDNRAMKHKESTVRDLVGTVQPRTVREGCSD